MTDIWSFLLQTLTASGAAALVLAVKWMFQDKLPPRWQFAVWGVLALVLLLPAGWGGRYALFNWPFYVEVLRSVLTGEYGALAQVTAPVPLPRWELPGDLAGWLFAVYALGVILLLARYLLSYLRLRLALRRGKPADPAPVRAVAEKYGLPACRCVEAEGLESAFLCGLLRPVLALPAGEAVDEKVLLHELVHLKQRDILWGVVIGLFRCLHWCNPLLWYCADRAGNDLEARCDQRVLELLEGEDRRDYGRILLSMANEKYARAPGTSSMANGGRNIRRRIEAIARFKRYPAGMGLVSACLILVLSASVAVGAKAELQTQGALNIPAELASARTTYCTTCAGAFDTYAKSVLTGRFSYRAMCAPLSEQNALAERYRTSAAAGHWEWTEVEDVETFSGYQIYNLTPAGEDVYEGLLVLPLNNAPQGEEWDGTIANRWLTVQPLRAEKEGDRWVVVPLGDFRPVQGDARVGGNVGLPAWEYEAPAGDFTLRMRWQTRSRVDSQEPSGGWFNVSTFNTAPQPGGEFTTWFDQIMLAEYTGAPGDRGRYQSIGAAYMPMWGDEERPALRGPGQLNSSGSSSTGEGWGQNTLDREYDTVFLIGGGSQREGSIDPPRAYAADLYLNEKKAAELTLLPVKGGLDLD